jgi:hypothetical protein
VAACTTAAVAGSLACAYWGIGGIPADWLSGMRGRDVAEPLIGRLLAATAEASDRSER